MRLWQERDAGLAPLAVTSPLYPGEEMTARVPLVGRLGDRLGNLVPGLEAAPGESQRTQPTAFCRPRRKPLILPSYAAGAEFVEFSATKSSARLLPWSWPVSG
jgi:hypothetical protein